jgi:hypothetical protein
MPTANELLNKSKNKFKTGASKEPSSRSAIRSYKRPWQENLSEDEVETPTPTVVINKSKEPIESDLVDPFDLMIDKNSSTEVVEPPKVIPPEPKPVVEVEPTVKAAVVEDIKPKKSEVYFTKNLALYKKILTLTSPERGFLYLMLREISDDDGMIRLSQKDLQNSLEMSEQTLRRNLRGLKDINLLTEVAAWDHKTKSPALYKVHELQSEKK